jgi:hypothetical protein
MGIDDLPQSLDGLPHVVDPIREERADAGEQPLDLLHVPAEMAAHDGGAPGLIGHAVHRRTIVVLAM